jgi:hypothetical protein
MGKGQGVAINSDDGRTILYNALKGRDASTNARINGDVNAALGPPVSPLEETQALKGQRSAIHGQLPNVFAAAGPVDTTGVLSNIAQGLPKAVGPEAAVLNKAKDWLMQRGTNAAGNPTLAPITDAETLHNAKSAIDTLIEYGDPSLGVQPGAVAKSQGAIGAVRRELNQALRDQVPGYSGIMDRSSALARKMDAIEEGKGLLAGGPNAVSPYDLNLKMSGQLGRPPMTPEEVAGLRIGARGAVDTALGTKANDLVALKGQLQGEGGWNQGKLASIFGAGPAGQLSDTVERNAAFRDTLNKIVENSQTAQRTGAAANMRAPSSPGHPLISPDTSPTGLLLTGAKNAMGAVTGMFKSDPTSSYGEIARILSAQGPQRDAHLTALVDALTRSSANAATGARLGNRAALAAALGGEQPLYDQLRPRLGAATQ